ncbi:MAG: hypothetical protein DMG78_13640 [Acidobacteria bacterium]|nr:MAG: hypothetical protein DMG78_13640 [Acidobacteriota bacterium]
MRKWILFTLIMMFALCAVAATKEKGKVALKDVQPAGVTDKKHKHQQYDLFFTITSGQDYTCRTSDKASVKATELVVGGSISYEEEALRYRRRGEFIQRWSRCGPLWNSGCWNYLGYGLLEKS